MLSKLASALFSPPLFLSLSYKFSRHAWPQGEINHVYRKIFPWWVAGLLP